ncbi:MAG TPA: response regulator transcription factor [Thermoanaerobaculia bacterium]|nr:response regulator transcription factor [Thermoanaerobaculia bacterium]
MEELARALLVGRHRLFRECLTARLEAAGRVRVAAAVDGLEAAGEWLDRASGDAGAELVIVDLSQPGEAVYGDLQALTTEHPEVHLVVLGLDGERDAHLRCIEAGARGYVLQEAGFEELDTALATVLAGGVACPPRLAFSMFGRLGELARERHRREQVDALDLTPRELEVLRLIADGMTNREIAEAVHLSVYTVKNHVHNLLDKLDVGHREAAVERAYEKGWLRERRRAAS